MTYDETIIKLRANPSKLVQRASHREGAIGIRNNGLWNYMSCYGNLQAWNYHVPTSEELFANDWQVVEE